MCIPCFLQCGWRGVLRHVHYMYLLVVRQLEQQVKLVLDNIGSDGDKKRELIRGEAVDKAEQLSKPPMYLSPPSSFSLGFLLPCSYYPHCHDKSTLVHAPFILTPLTLNLLLLPRACEANPGEPGCIQRSTLQAAEATVTVHVLPPLLEQIILALLLLSKYQSHCELRFTPVPAMHGNLASA